MNSGIYRGHSWCQRMVFGNWPGCFTVDHSYAHSMSVLAHSTYYINKTIFVPFSSMICQEDYPCHTMPADIVANGIIVLAYECGKRYEKR